MRLSGDKCKNKWLSLSLSIRMRDQHTGNGCRAPSIHEWSHARQSHTNMECMTLPDSYKHPMYDIIKLIKTWTLKESYLVGEKKMMSVYVGQGLACFHSVLKM